MTKNLLLLFNLIATTSILAYPFMFISAVMALGGSGTTSPIKIFAVSYMWLYPIPILVGAMKAWKSRNDQNISLLVRYTLITFFGFLPIAGFFIYGIVLYN